MILGFLVVFNLSGSAQDGVAVPQKDIVDIVSGLSGRKSDRSDTIKVQPGKVELSYLPVVGYSLQTSLLGGITGSVAFRADSAKVSNIPITAAYTFRRQTVFYILPNVWSKNNRYNYVGELGFLHFPQITFGIGPDTRMTDSVQIDYYQIKADQSVLRKLRKNFFAGMGYVFDYYWKARVTSPNADLTERYSDYKMVPSTRTSGISLTALYDSRESSINPQGGTYAAATLKTYLSGLGSTSNWQSLLIDVRKYLHFPRNSKNIVALWTYNQITLRGNPPYNNLPGTAFDNGANTGRGYIQGRFRGLSMFYQEAEYRFGITRNGFIGGVVFANAQSFTDDHNSKPGKPIPGYGFGVRLKLNKFSNTNLQVDYAFGREGSRGVFLGVCEVF